MIRASTFVLLLFTMTSANTYGAGGGPGAVAAGTTSTAGSGRTGTLNGALYGGGTYGGGTSRTYRNNPLYVDDFGLRFIPSSNPAAGLVPFNYHGSTGYPVFGIWGGFGGTGPSEYGYFSGSYTARQQARTAQMRRQTSPPPAPLALANVQQATLTVRLPASGEIWVNGVKSGNELKNEWTLASPEIKEGEQYTFDVKAKWVAAGKSYDYSRAITVDGGKRSQVQVLGGTPVK